MAIKKQDIENTDALTAEKHDKRARKDATLNMRISSDLLKEIQVVAKSQGFDKYQSWAHMVLEMAVAEAQNKQ
jgi:predicted DNA binding CopG/RHH family protein